MSLSLEYIGKLFMILVALAIGVGLIMTIQGDVNDWIPDLGGEKDDLDSEFVDVGNDAAEIASLINMCYSESRERRYESFNCFLARSEDGTFSLSAADIESELSNTLQENTEFLDDTFDRETIVIRYDVSHEAVVVEK